MSTGTGKTAMQAFTLSALALALLCAAPARADDCDDVMKRVEDTVQVANQVLQAEMAEIKAKGQPADDKAKATFKNTFCSASGEFVGISKAYRAVAAECLKGGKRRDTLASLDTSIKQLGDSIRQTCD
jgi:hypothetical protein